MFYQGESVRSRLFGLGVVVTTGDSPVVEFLDGREIKVPGETINVIPGKILDAEIENRREIEWYLSCRVSGVYAPFCPALPRPEFDLVAAMRRNTLIDRLPPVEPVDEFVPPFTADGVLREVVEVTDNTSPGGGRRVRVTVSKETRRTSGLPFDRF